MKRLFSFTLMLLICLNILPIVVIAADSDFSISNGVLVKYNGSGGDVIIPDGVTTIGKSAFLGCETIKKCHNPKWYNFYWK